MKFKTLITVIVIILIQIFLSFYWDSGSADITGFMFLSGLYPGEHYVLQAVWYLFFAGISFSSMGYFRKYVTEIGLYVMIRENSRVKIIVIRTMKLFMMIAIFCFIQLVLSSIISYTMGVEQAFFVNHISAFLKIVFLYVLSIFVVIYFQVALELWFTEQVALLASNMYVLVSVSLGGILLTSGKHTWFLYFLLPNFGMYQRTNLSKLHYGVSPTFAACILLSVIALLFFIIGRKMKETDII
jgi:hypothetical protein